jgi:GTP-binding protein EngB required for normal cell division
LKDQLAELQRILEDMGTNFLGFAATAEELRHRLDEGCFRLAVLGQFKRGKSTLLNALLGEPLLPVGILPLTAIPTSLRYGPERQVHVTLQNGRREGYGGSLEDLARVLMRYVTERENPANRLGVIQVEVEHPASLLAKGVEIIDTPGIGSTVLHNTRMARAMLPVCDGAIFVLSPDPPITEVEVQFLRAVHEAAVRVIFVLTKADMLTSSECRELLLFLQTVLHDEAGFSNQERIFLVSAQQALEASAQGDEQMRAQSAIGELESFLVEFLLTDKRAALHEAIQRKGARLTREGLFALDLQRKVIELPREDLERRTQRFEAHLEKLGMDRVYFHDRLAGDRRRLLEELDQQAVALFGPTQEALTAFVRKACEEAGHTIKIGRIEAHIRSALSEEVQRIFERATNDLLARATERFQSVQDVHCRETELLIDRIRRTAADLFEVPSLTGVTLDRLEAVREPCLVGHRWVTSFTEEAASWMSRFLPRRLRAKWIERRLYQDIGYLVARNIGELRWTTNQNLEEAFRLFETRMDTQLESTIQTIQHSIRTAFELQTQRDSRLGPELDRLRSSRERLEQLLTALSPQERADAVGGPV